MDRTLYPLYPAGPKSGGHCTPTTAALVCIQFALTKVLLSFWVLCLPGARALPPAVLKCVTCELHQMNRRRRTLTAGVLFFLIQYNATNDRNMRRKCRHCFAYKCSQTSSSIICVCVSVCLSVRTIKPKRLKLYNHQLATGIVHHESWLPISY